MRLFTPTRVLASSVVIASALLAVACGRDASSITRPSLRSGAIPLRITRPPNYDGTLWLCKVGPSSATGVVYSLRVTATGGSFVYGTESGGNTFGLTVIDGSDRCQNGAGAAALFYVRDGSIIHVTVEELFPTPNGAVPQSWALVWDNGAQTPITTTGAQNSFTFDLNTTGTLNGIMFDQKLTLTNGPTTQGSGCTPGYWKVPQHWDSWPSGYLTTAKIKTYFPNAQNFTLNGVKMGDYSLVDGLSFQGGPDAVGGAQILLRAGIAGLLNSASGFTPAYPMTTAQVLSAVSNALASGNKATMVAVAATIDANNNFFCPLN